MDPVSMVVVGFIALVVWSVITMLIVKIAVKNALRESAPLISKIIRDAREGRAYEDPTPYPHDR